MCMCMCIRMCMSVQRLCKRIQGFMIMCKMCMRMLCSRQSTLLYSLATLADWRLRSALQHLHGEIKFYELP